jgi:UrcA family protein
MNMKAYLCHWTFNSKTLLPEIGLAVMLAAVTGTVLADPPPAVAKTESVAATVSLADLDVSTPQGARAATARLAKVVQRLCRKLGDTRRVSNWATYADCYSETLADALRRLHVPVLASAASPIPPQH